MSLAELDLAKHPRLRWYENLKYEDQDLFDEVLEFFDDPGRVRRMKESEVHHDRPALYGVVRELRRLPSMARLADAERKTRVRVAQFVGVVVGLVMEQEGWAGTGHKAALGDPSFLQRGERYVPAKGYPGRELWVENHPTWKAKERPARKPTEPDIDDQGRTKAQRMRDLILHEGLSNEVLEEHFSKKTLRLWELRAECDEASGGNAGVQPSDKSFEKVRSLINR